MSQTDPKSSGNDAPDWKGSDRTGTTSRVVFAGYGHEVTESEREVWRKAMNAKAQAAFHRGQQLVEFGRAQEALLWLGRAERLARKTPNVSFAFATAALSVGRIQECLVRVHALKARFGMREAAFIEVACLWRLKRIEEAAVAMASALAENHAGAELAPLARDIAEAAGYPGWCTLSNSGILHVEVSSGVTVRLDGDVCIQGGRERLELPSGWQQGYVLEVRVGRRHVLGSPIDIRRLTRCESLVWPVPDGVSGWIWYPGEPDLAPLVQVEGCAPIRVEAYATEVDSDSPLARPRAFHIPLHALPGEGAVSVGLRNGNGMMLTGSPLRPDVGRLLKGQLRGLPGDLMPAPVSSSVSRPSSGIRDVSSERACGCAVVIPVYRDMALTLDCLKAVLATISPDTIVVIVDDASPDPGLKAAVRRMAAEKCILLLENEENLGFPASANRGMQAVKGRDVILLNSDTLVPEGWVERLRAWLDGTDIGTVTPFSNDASILSYPSVKTRNPVPGRADLRRLDRLCQRVSPRLPVELPTGNGFCMAISAACLAAVGPFREDLFAQGYGEENEFCVRASTLGFKHIAATDLFVAHVGSASFGASRNGLMARNLRILNALHPGYETMVADFIARDPLGEIRRAMERESLRVFCGRRPVVVMIQHDAGGGVGRAVRERALGLAEKGSRVLILRPTSSGCIVEPFGAEGVSAGLSFKLPEQHDTLVAFLQSIRTILMEWHHLVGHAPSIRTLHAALGVPYDIFIHDHVWFCPRISLLDGAGRYCGEPDVEGCIECTARWGSFLGEDITLPELLARSRFELLQARRCVAPTRDTARRLERHFPGLEIEIAPLEDDVALASVPIKVSRRGTSVLRICVLGGISRWKGFDVLLALATDIRTRRLPIVLVLVGHTPDDDALLEQGIIVTGEYCEEEAAELIASQEADLGFIPSVAPETWCYALTRLREAGLPVLCFDLGAQGERVRALGGPGQVLPLGMPPAMLADAFLRYWRAL